MIAVTQNVCDWVLVVGILVFVFIAPFVDVRNPRKKP